MRRPVLRSPSSFFSRSGRAGTAARRASGVTVLTAALVLVGGSAFAYWSIVGSGSTTAQTTTTTPLTASGTVNGALYPGGPARNLDVTLTNPGTTDVTGTGLSGAVVSAAGGQGACAVNGASSGVSVASQAVTVSIPAGGQATVTLPGAVTMSTSSATGCQGATFTISLQVTGRVG